MKLIIIYTTLVNIIKPHLIFDTEQTWGIKNSISLENPLDQSTANPLCAGISPEENGIITLKAGETYNFNVNCGERDLNAPGCLIGDWHSGEFANDYAGCALAVNYEDYKNINNYYYISYSKECAKRGEPTNFIISENVKSCDKCVCSWSWAPSRMYSSPGQFYHNCFYCSIIGNNLTNEENMRQLDFINIKDTKYIDTTYNEINPMDIYSINSASSTSMPKDIASSSTSGTSMPKDIISSSTSETSIPEDIISTSSSTYGTSMPKDIISSSTSETSIPEDIISTSSSTYGTSMPKDITSSSTYGTSMLKDIISSKSMPTIISELTITSIITTTLTSMSTNRFINISTNTFKSPKTISLNTLMNTINTNTLLTKILSPNMSNITIRCENE